MKITITFLIVLLAGFTVQFGSALPHPHHKLHKVVGAAGAGALALKPKIVAGGALAGKALLGKALLGKVLLGKVLLKKPLLIAGGLVAAKLAKKALLVGAGALAAKKLIRAVRAKKPCRRTCSRCSRVRTVESAKREAVREEVRKIEKRSIIDYVSRGVERVSTGIESLGTRLSNFGDSLRRGGERVRDVSNDSRLAGAFITDTIRARTGSLLNRAA